MKAHSAAWAALLLTGATGAAHAQAGGMREVNITSDSKPGWLPSLAEEEQAKAAASAYLQAIDVGQAERAYAMMTAENQAMSPRADFVRELTAFSRKAGRLLDRRILKITWTSGSMQVPSPGTYAAIDVAARYAGIDRQCGYIIAYRRPGETDFRIARAESNSIDNASAAEIERTKGRATLDRLWRELSSNCPNYPGS